MWWCSARTESPAVGWQSIWPGAPQVGARWAASGRDAGRIRATLESEGMTAANVIVADATDAASLAELAARTRVVLNTAGPFTLFGEAVVQACVAQGAHYVDLTGEIPFARHILDRYDAPAAEAGVKIVQICGMESMPPDLAVLLAAETAWERWGERLTEADLLCTVKLPSGLSPLTKLGGTATIHSELAALEDDGRWDLRDPASLITDPTTAQAVRSASPISLRPRTGPHRGAVAPMVLAPFLNPAVIARTAALLAAERGEALAPMRYREGFLMPGSTVTLPLRFAAAAALSGAQMALARLAAAPLSRRAPVVAALRRILPDKPVSPTKQHEWAWAITLSAHTATGRRIRVDVHGEGHPGYLSVAQNMGEVGLLLSRDGATPQRSGYLTPATALGTRCAASFSHSGM